VKVEEIHCYSVLISGLDGCEWSDSRPSRYAPWSKSSVPVELKGGWNPEPVGALWRREKFLVSVGNQTSVLLAHSSVTSPIDAGRYISVNGQCWPPYTRFLKSLWLLSWWRNFTCYGNRLFIAVFTRFHHGALCPPNRIYFTASLY
jgi:hypothetical protein